MLPDHLRATTTGLSLVPAPTSSPPARGTGAPSDLGQPVLGCPTTSRSETEVKITKTRSGLDPTTPANDQGWVKKYRLEHAGEEPALELSERAELQELRRRVREQEMELAFLKKTAAYFAREQR